MQPADAFAKTSNASKCTAAVTGKGVSATRVCASARIAKIWLTDWSRRKRENWSSSSEGTRLLINDRIFRWDGKVTHRQWTQWTTHSWTAHAKSRTASRSTAPATSTTNRAVRPVVVKTATTNLTSMMKKKRPDGKRGTQGTTMIVRLYRLMTSTRSTSFCSRHRKNTKPNNCISIWSSSPWIFSLMTLEMTICRFDLEIPSLTSIIMLTESIYFLIEYFRLLLFIEWSKNYLSCKSPGCILINYPELFKYDSKNNESKYIVVFLFDSVFQ